MLYFEVETTRNDTNYEPLLEGKQNNQFEFFLNDPSGLWVGGAVEDADFIKTVTLKVILH